MVHMLCCGKQCKWCLEMLLSVLAWYFVEKSICTWSAVKTLVLWLADDVEFSWNCLEMVENLHLYGFSPYSNFYLQHAGTSWWYIVKLMVLVCWLWGFQISVVMFENRITAWWVHSLVIKHIFKMTYYTVFVCYMSVKCVYMSSTDCIVRLWTFWDT